MTKPKLKSLVWTVPVLAIALALVAVAVLSTGLWALDSDHFQYDLRLPAGGQKSFSFTVVNDGPEATEARVYLQDWDMTPAGELRFLAAGTLPRSAAGWIAVRPTQFALARGEKRQVTFTLDVPPGAEGTHWAMIFVETAPRQVAQEGKFEVTRTERVGVQVLETPPVGARRQANISGMEAADLDPLTIRIEVQNTGNVRLRPEGRLEIRDRTGRAVKSLPIETFFVLPGRTRLLELALDEEGGALPPGDYLALAILDYGGEARIGGQLRFEVPNS